MKKAIAYVAAAVILGFATMMLPLALKTEPPFTRENTYPKGSSLSVEDDTLRESYGLAQPSSFLPSSLIFLSGLIVAVGAYAVLKRQFHG